MRYVKSGGTLLILGSSGIKDQYGLPQKQIALAQLLGGQSYPGTELTRKAGKGRVIFMPVVIPKSRFLIASKTSGEYTTFGPTMADLFPDIPEGYTRNRMDPALRSLLEQLAGKIKDTLGTRVTRLTSTAPYLEITTMMDKTAKRMLLHVVNYDVTLDGTITPARNVKLQVVLPRDRKPRAITWSGTLADMKPVQYQSVRQGDQQTLVLNLDEVGIYGLANIELEPGM